MSAETVGLEELKNQLDRITAEIATAVAEERATGRSWAQIGEQLGISKQAAQQKYGKTTATVRTPAGIIELGPEDFGTPDVAGQSVTPSIFLEPKAPAPAPAKALPIYLQPGMIHSLTNDYTKHEEDPSYPAQPGTGKGPHSCPRCERTNHHGPQQFTITFFRDCTPTRYDPPATVAEMADWKNRNKNN